MEQNKGLNFHSREKNSLYFSNTILYHHFLICVNLYVGAKNINVNIRDKNNSTPLIVAAGVGDENLLIWLIQEKATVNSLNSNGHSALHYACMHTHLDCVKILLKNGADVNLTDHDGGPTPAYETVRCWNGREEESISILQELCNHGADLNIKNYEGNTPALIIAMRWNASRDEWDEDKVLSILQKLCDYGANLTIENNSRKSASNLLPQEILKKLK